MIQIGARFALRWPKYAHLLNAEVVALEADCLVVDLDHRCGPLCYLQQMRGTLPIHGRHKYDYRDFADAFEPLAEDAIALGAGR